MINSIYIYPSDLDDRIVLILVGMTRDTRGKMISGRCNRKLMLPSRNCLWNGSSKRLLGNTVTPTPIV